MCVCVCVCVCGRDEKACGSRVEEWGTKSGECVCWKVEGQGVPGPGIGIAGCVCACGEGCEDRVC